MRKAKLKKLPLKSEEVEVRENPIEDEEKDQNYDCVLNALTPKGEYEDKDYNKNPNWYCNSPQ